MIYRSETDHEMNEDRTEGCTSGILTHIRQAYQGNCPDTDAFSHYEGTLIPALAGSV